MILVFGGQKGGPGKSTLVEHAGVARAMDQPGRSVAFYDTDRQESLARWNARRRAHNLVPDIVVYQSYGPTVGTEIAQLAKHGFDDVVVDTAGQDAKELRAAMTVADRLVTVVQSSIVDLETMEHMDDMVGECRLVNPALLALVAINRSRSQRDEREARSVLSRLANYRLMTAVVADRVAVQRASISGRVVFELLGSQSDSAATQEMLDFSREVWA